MIIVDELFVRWACDSGEFANSARLCSAGAVWDRINGLGHGGRFVPRIREGLLMWVEGNKLKLGDLGRVGDVAGRTGGGSSSVSELVRILKTDTTYLVRRDPAPGRRFAQKSAEHHAVPLQLHIGDFHL